MEARISRRITTLERATRFVREHPVPVSHVTTLIDSIDAIVAELYHSAGQQRIGHASFRSGAAIRASHAAELLALMRSVNRIARALDPNEFPGLREQFRMPRGDGYQRLLSHAAAFAQAAQPILAIFLERGLEPDFIQQILARREEIHAGLTIKNNGFSQRLSGTASLAALTRRAMPLLRELDAILTHQYRNDAGLLAAWKGACHVERDPESAPNDAIPERDVEALVSSAVGAEIRDGSVPHSIEGPIDPTNPTPAQLNPAKLGDLEVVKPIAVTERVQSASVLASYSNHESPPPRHWRLHPVPNRLPHVPR
jgi:hypothetical protein